MEEQLRIIITVLLCITFLSTNISSKGSEESMEFNKSLGNIANGNSLGIIIVPDDYPSCLLYTSPSPRD